MTTLWYECPACNAENQPIGVLGKKVQYHCRFCGWWYSVEAEEEEEEQEEEDEL